MFNEISVVFSTCEILVQMESKKIYKNQRENQENEKVAQNYKESTHKS